MLAALSVALAGCSVVSDWVAPPDQPARLSSTADKVGRDTEFPNLASVPNAPPKVTPPARSRAIMEGLVADRANAEYTDQTLHPGATASLEQLGEVPGIFEVAPGAGVESAPVTEALSPVDGGATEEAPETTIPETTIPEATGSDAASAETTEAPPRRQASAATAGPEAAAGKPQARTEVAALPQAADVDAGARILFDAGSAELSDAARSELAAVADRLLRNGDARVQLRAYADGNGDGSSDARRLSLSRAIAVRRFLIDQGVPSARMDVRALGDRVEDKPADRVDVLIAAR